MGIQYQSVTRLAEPALKNRPDCLHLPRTYSILEGSNSYLKPNIFNPKYSPMKQNVELQSPATGKVLFKLTLIGCVLLGCVYGFLVLFNTALAAIK